MHTRLVVPVRVWLAAVMLSAGIGAGRLLANDVQEMVRLLVQVNGHAAARQFNEAEPVAKRLIELTERRFAGDAGVRVIASSSVAVMYDLQGRYTEAEPHLFRVSSLSGSLAGTDALPATDALTLAAMCYSGQKRLAEADSLHRRVLAIKEAALGPRHPDLAQPLTQLGQLALQQAHQPEAEFYYRRAVAAIEARKGPRAVEAGLPLLGLASVSLKQDRFEDAEALARRVVDLANASPVGQANMVSGVSLLGRIAERRGRYAEAEATYRRALQLRQGMSMQEKAGFVASDRRDVARALRLQRRFKEAAETLDRAIQDIRGDPYSEPPLQLELAHTLADQERWAEAKTVADRAAAMQQKTGGDGFAAKVLRGRVTWAAGHREEAIDTLAAAIEQAEVERRLGTGGAEDRARLFELFAAAFETLAGWLIDSGRNTEAFAVSERIKARSLLDQMEMRGGTLLVGVPDENARRLEWQASASLTVVRTLARRLEEASKARADDPGTAARAATIRAQLETAKQQYFEAFRDLQHASPAYRLALSRDFQPVGRDAAVDWLRQNDAILLEYMVGEESSFLFVIDTGHGGLSALRLSVEPEIADVLGIPPGPLTAAALRRVLATDSRKGVMDAVRTPDTGPAATRQLSALWRVLVPESLRERLLNGVHRRLVVIPDGDLARLPFECLVVEDGGEPTYLLDVGPAVITAPSMTVLMNLSDASADSAPRGDRKILTVGNPDYSGGAAVVDDFGAASRYPLHGGLLTPLPHSATESKSVRDAFSRNGVTVEQLLDRDATEQRVRRSAPGSRVLHFACHGLVDESHGNLFGALALASPRGSADEHDDGFLTVGEITKLDFRTCDLAILSACNTNDGPLQKGEGVFSLARACFVAGARRVIASAWVVDDEAAAVLVGYLCDGVATAESRDEVDLAEQLQGAKRFVRQNSRWRSPYFWAPFTLVGPK